MSADDGPADDVLAALRAGHDGAQRRDFEAARAGFTRAAMLLRESRAERTPTLDELRIGVNVLGLLAAAAGRLDDARNALEQGGGPNPAGEVVAGGVWRAMAPGTAGLLSAGLQAHAEGRPRDALDLLGSALQRARAQADQPTAALVMTNLATVLLDLGEFEHALTAALYRRIDDTAGLAAALNNIGGLAQSLSRLPEAITAAEEALLLHRAAGDVGGQVSAENTVGWALRDLGRPEEALLRLRAAARLARESGDRYLIGANANRVGGVYLALGRIDEAIEEYRAAAIAAQIEAPAAEAAALVNLATLRQRCGDLNAAAVAVAVARALRLSLRIGDHYTEAVAMAVAGRIAAANP